MGRLKVFIYFILFFIASGSIAQPVDTVAFRYERDVSTFKIWCYAQRVDIASGDTTYTDFLPEDTVTAYKLDWGGTTEPVKDRLPRVLYKYTAPGTYTVSLSVFETATGKTITYSQDVEINDLIRVPNVFTPNGDGRNDLFIIRANGITPLEISIYTRTGTKVYNTKAPIIVWDGRNSSGAEMSEGVYYYVLTSDDPLRPVQKGFFHLYK